MNWAVKWNAPRNTLNGRILEPDSLGIKRTKSSLQQTQSDTMFIGTAYCRCLVCRCDLCFWSFRVCSASPVPGGGYPLCKICWVVSTCSQNIGSGELAEFSGTQRRLMLETLHQMFSEVTISRHEECQLNHSAKYGVLKLWRVNKSGFCCFDDREDENFPNSQLVGVLITVAWKFIWVCATWQSYFCFNEGPAC